MLLELSPTFFDSVLETKLGFKPIKAVGKLKEYIRSKREQSELGEEFNPYSDLNNAKATVIKALSKLSENNRVIILIDELDRCDPRYAMKTLERIHHISSSTKSISIVAVDKEQLENSIKTVYSYGSDDVSKHYLRKIVDMTYELGNGIFDEDKRSLLFGELEKLYSAENTIVTEKELVQFEYAIFQELDIRRMERLINYTIVCHKTIFKERECSLILMFAELLLGWALLRIKNKKDLLSEMSKEYSSNKAASVYSYIKEKTKNNVISDLQTYDGRPCIIVNSASSYLLYIIKAAKRNTIGVDYRLPEITNEENVLLLNDYLSVITNSSI